MSNAQYYAPSDGSRRSRHRNRDYDEESYVGIDDYPSSRRAPGQYDLIRRPREDSDSYVEEVQRDFPPAGYDTYGRPTRPSNRRRASSLDTFDAKRSAAYVDTRRDGSDRGSERGRRSRAEGEKGSHKRSKSRAQEIAAAGVGALVAAGGKELWDREQTKKHPNRARSKSKSRLATAGLGVAGALAGAELAKYAIKQKAEHDDKERSDNPRAKGSRRKSFGDAAMGMIGPALATQDPRNGNGYGRRDGRGRYDDRSRGHRGSSRSRSPKEQSEKIQQALKAALTAAAAEGWRSRDEPGGALSGEKLRRIVTAAVSAAGVDALVDKDPEDHSTRNTVISALAGLLGNRVINGSRDADFGTRDGGRDRSYSRGRGRDYSRDGRRSSSNGPGVGSLAGIGAAAAAGKALWDRSRSRKGDRRRSVSSDDSYDSRSHRRDRPRRSRSRSVIDRGLAKLGLGDGDKKDRDRDRGRDRSDSRGRDDEYGRSRGGIRGGAETRSKSNSSDSSMESDEEKKRRRKMRGKEYLFAGLATAASVNAAHEVYESMENTVKRRKALKEGKISPEEARKAKLKGHTKDAIALTLAGIGVKGAIDTWKETNHVKNECHEFETKRAEHRHKREERDKSARSHIDRTDDYVSAPIYDEPVGYAGQGPVPPPAAGPIYSDGNPYSAGGGPPPPPVSGGPRGYDDRYY